MNKVYIVSWVGYQHCNIGCDDYDGWNSWTDYRFHKEKEDAVQHVNTLKKDRFIKNIKSYIAEEIEL